MNTMLLFLIIILLQSWNSKKQQDLFNLLGSIYSAVMFLGASNASAVQPIVGIERTVFYRERAAGMYSAVPYAFGQVRRRIIFYIFKFLFN